MKARLMPNTLGTATARLFALLAVVGLAACERPPIQNVQYGFRGLGKEQNINPRIWAEKQAANKAPAALPSVAGTGKAGPWQKVEVLAGLDSAEMLRTMTAMSSWVAQKNVKATESGCLYCHNPANYASDEKYQKVVARRMLQMTQNINANYTKHVAQTGVTCYTCHRGGPVPEGVWYYTGRNQPLRHYLDREGILVTSNFSLAKYDTNHSSVKQAEYAYAVMNNVTHALGVNCTFCHNTRALNRWDESTPKRLTALRGIQMVRDLNMTYLLSLQSVWPAGARHVAPHLGQEGSLVGHKDDPTRLGPMGDGAKLQCSTCHNGVYKPLFGAQMAKDYPAMYPVAAPAATEAPAAPTPAKPKK